VDLKRLRCEGGADRGDVCLSDPQIEMMTAVHSPFELPFPVANGLTVYPPGAFTAAQIPFRFRACSAAGPAFLSVQVVLPRVGVPGH